MKKFIFACVLRESDVYKPYHVNRLIEMISGALPAEVKTRAVCFTDCTEGFREEIQLIPLPDDPHLQGWFAKMYMFKNEWPEGHQVFYFDLDTVITGHLDGLLEYEGRFAGCNDFLYPGNLNSSVLSWRWDFGPEEIWEKWEKQGFPLAHGGDQVLMQSYVPDYEKLQDFWPDKIYSYKKDCKLGLPGSASVVCFHGKPKPWDDPSILNMPNDFWIHETYTEGRRIAKTMRTLVNEDEEKIKENIRINSRRKLAWLKQCDANDRTVCIVGGGPSLKETLPRLRQFYDRGATIVGLNGSNKFLQDHGIKPTYQVMLDARPENIRFIEESDAMRFYLASQVHPDCFELAMKKGDVVIYHTNKKDIDDLLPDAKPEHTLLAAGTTVGNNAVALCYAKGYRDIHVFGMDSSITETSHHAYEQPENEGLDVCYADINGKRFLTQNWMAAQATEFYRLARILADGDCTIHVHGEGTLLAEIAKNLVVHDGRFNRYRGKVVTNNDIVNREAVFKEVWDARRIKDVVGPGDICIQAGGNWGLFAIEYATHFDSVYTFEPDKDNYDALVQNVEESGFKNIVHFNAGLAGDVGRRGIIRDNLNHGAHRLSAGDDVDVVSIDSLGLLACSLIHLDTEGFELEALKGGEELIDRCKPAICVEGKSSAKELHDWLAEKGYKLVGVFGVDKLYKHESVL